MRQILLTVVGCRQQITYRTNRVSEVEADRSQFTVAWTTESGLSVDPYTSEGVDC